MGGFFGRIFLGGFFGRSFFGRIFGRNFLRGILFGEFFVKLVCQDFGFCQDFVSIKKEEEGKKFRSLEVRRKLIALKKIVILFSSKLTAKLN